MAQTAAAVPRRTPSALLGMIIFITSELMFFGALFGAYFTLRAQADQWPSPGTPHIDTLRTAIFTVFLVTSSFTQHLGVVAIRRGDKEGLVRWTAITIALGALFLAGQALEYTELFGEGFTIGTNVFGTLFFTMTGFHGLHVAGGLLMLGIVTAKARMGHFSSDRHGPAEAVGYYWHFVDVVWIFLFVVLYLLT
ncbi:MAG: aa3-type cytochrome oxidase subunit III [Actinomycetota bacterium]